MRALIQRVSEARVTVDGQECGAIGAGMLIFLGIRAGDTGDRARHLAERCLALRIFEDANGKMNLSIKETGGSVLVVSQFTLYGDTRRGNRPSFTEAAPPTVAEPLYEQFLGHLRSLHGASHVAAGVFRAMMDVSLVNDGPVTLLLESENHDAPPA